MFVFLMNERDYFLWTLYQQHREQKVYKRRSTLLQYVIFRDKMAFNHCDRIFICSCMIMISRWVLFIQMFCVWLLRFCILNLCHLNRRRDDKNLFKIRIFYFFRSKNSQQFHVQNLLLHLFNPKFCYIWEMINRSFSFIFVVYVSVADVVFESLQVTLHMKKWRWWEGTILIKCEALALCSAELSCNLMSSPNALRDNFFNGQTAFYVLHITRLGIRFITTGRQPKVISWSFAPFSVIIWIMLNQELVGDSNIKVLQRSASQLKKLEAITNYVYDCYLF